MHIRLKTFLLLVSPLLLVVAAAYVQWGTVGLPALPPEPHDDPRNGGGAPRLSGLAAHHPLRQLPVHDPARPQRPADPHGPPPAVLERPLHARHGVAPAHAGRGAEGPRLDGQGRLPLPLPLDRPARLPAHHRHGPALALPQRAVLGGQRRGLRGPAVRDRPVEAPGARLLANRARRLGRLRPLRHVPPAAGAERLLPLQRPPATRVLRRGVRPGAAGDPDRALDVAGADEPVHVVSEAARQPADRPVASLPRHVRLRHLPRRPCDHGGDHRVCPEHEPHRRGHRRHQPDRRVPRPGGDRRDRRGERARQLAGVATAAGSCSTSPRRSSRR